MRKSHKILLAVVVASIFVFNQVRQPNDFYHKVWWDEALGYRIGKRGAIRYLLDWKGDRIGGGYHSYFLKDGVVYGKLGATIEIVVSADGEVNTEGGADRILKNQ